MDPHELGYTIFILAENLEITFTNFLIKELCAFEAAEHID